MMEILCITLAVHALMVTIAAFHVVANSAREIACLKEEFASNLETLRVFYVNRRHGNSFVLNPERERK